MRSTVSDNMLFPGSVRDLSHTIQRVYLVILTAICPLIFVSGCASPRAPLTESQQPQAYVSRAEWRPTFDLPKVVITAGDQARYRSWYLKQFSQWLGLSETPRVRVVRVGYPEVIAPLQVECLDRVGIKATLEPEGFSYSEEGMPRDRESRRQRFICSARFFVDARLSLAPTPMQLRAVHEYLTHFVVPCLTRQGVPTDPVPSEESFVASGGDGWNYPMSSVDQVIRAQCNSKIPSKIFLGD